MISDIHAENDPVAIAAPAGSLFRKIVTLVALVVGFVALCGLLGYVSGLRLLGSIRGDYIPMAPSSALCFLIFSAVLLRGARRRLDGISGGVLSLLAFLATVFCLLELSELVVGIDLNFSDKLFPVRENGGTFPVGRMSPVTAATFALSGLATLLLIFSSRSQWRSERVCNWIAALGALTTLTGATILLAYLYGTPLMYGSGSVPMAATTALAFLLLGVAVLLSSGPDTCFIRRITGDSTAALLSRVFIPLIVSAIILQSILTHALSSLPMINEALVQAVMAVITGSITAALVERVARFTGRNIDGINRKLQQTLDELRESEDHHRDILRTAMDGIILSDLEGRITEVNEAYCRMSGYCAEQLQQMNICDLAVYEDADGCAACIRSIIGQGELCFENRHRRQDGSTYDIDVSAKYRPAKGGYLVLFCHDISERKLRDSAHQQTGNLLQLASSYSDLHECMSALTISLKSWSGCEAVGIRLRDGDDFPYFETRGFSSEFVASESRLCSFDAAGMVMRDADGNPVLECMCGNILSGRFDPTRPFFTLRGSFWSNNTSALLASTTMEERQAYSRNRCNRDGYQSVALIPMHAGDKIVGLLQFNDHRMDRFTATLVDILEDMADKVALALSRRQAEKELHQREKLHHDLLNNIPDLIWLKDVAGVYLSCNATFERFFAAREADIIGKTDYDFVDRELADFFRENDRKAMAAGRPTSNEEWVTFGDDGHRALLFTTKMPLYDGEEKLVGILGVGRDITQLKQAEEAVRESENRLRYALEGTNDGLWDVRLQDSRTYLSPRGCQILGYGEDEGESVAKVWSELVHPDDLPITEERLREHLEGRAAIFEVEQRLRTKSGGWKWIHTRGKVVEHDQDGTPLRITGMHSDITEKKQLEAQLHQAQKLESVGRLAGGVAHDFNNMLGVIIGHASLALMKTTPLQPIHKHLVEINAAAERSADLTRQLLAFARKQTIAPKVLDLNESISGMLKMLQRLIGEDVQLCWLPGNKLWPVKMDASQIDQILANLCVNARDAVENFGKIIIETGTMTIDKVYAAGNPDAVPGNYVWLSVSDDGCGMDKETLAHIYEPFYTTKGIGAGTGLGLATVYGAVRQNNGFINVYSEPGHGTTFTLYIPRYNGPNEQVAQEPGVVAPSRGHETILLVEDEPSILETSSILLENQGYTVLTAATPLLAVQMADEHSGEIHLLLTDIIMPEMNGRDLAALLARTNPQIKQLFMSGYTADIIAQHGVLDEGVQFIQKPFSLATLAEKVRQVLDTP